MFLLVSLLASSISSAGVQRSVFGGRTNRALNTTATVYAGIHGSGGYTTPEASFQQVAATAGNISYLRCYLSGAPGASKTYTFDVRVNATSPAGQCTCAITGASATSCSDLTCNMSVSATDLVGFRAIPTSTPTLRNGYCTAIWNAASSSQQNIWGLTNDPTTTATTEYTGIQGADASWGVTEANEVQIVSTAGTLNNLYINLVTAPGAGKSTAFTVMLNGSAPAGGLACTVSGTGKTCSDTSNSITVAANDKLSLRYVPTSTPAATETHFGMTFKPTIDGESLYLNGTGAPTFSASATNYGMIWERPMANATETNVQNIVQANITIKSLYVVLDTAPQNGAGTQSYTYTVEKNATATAITCTISETAASCSDLIDTVQFLDNDLIGLKSVPSGTPIAGVVHYGVTELLKRRVY